MYRYGPLVLGMSDEELSGMKESGVHPREQKDVLGRRLVEKFYTAEAAEEASKEFTRIFSEKQSPTDIPEWVAGSDDVEDGKVGLLTLLVMVGFCSSNGEARRLFLAEESKDL